MIAVGSYYHIAEQEIEAISRDENGGVQYPYTLKVKTKGGREYAINYQDKKSRDNEVVRIITAVDAYNRDHNPTLQIIRWAIEAEVNKLRPYLRRIEKMLKEAKT